MRSVGRRYPFRPSWRAVVGALAILACGGDSPTGPAPVASVTIVASSSSVSVGKSITLDAITRGADGTELTGRKVDWGTSAPNVATVSDAGVVTGVAVGSATITATSEGKSGSTSVTVTTDVATVAVVSPSTPVIVRSITSLSATVKDADDHALTGRTVSWQSSDTNVVRVDAAGSMIAFGAGTANVTASVDGKSGEATITVSQGAFPLRGIYMQFERRNWPSGWFSGNIIDSLTDVDPTSGQTVQSDVATQLDAVAAMGVNTITFELRSTDAVRDTSKAGFPTCNTGPDLGILYPQPETKKLDNLVTVFDMAQARGIKVLLRLVNRNFDTKYRTDSQAWITAILNRLKSHPALELVLFEGDAKNIDAKGDGVIAACGGQAEPPLWLGPTSYAAEYLEWAFGYAHSLGLPWRKISAQATVGSDYRENNGGAGPAATDRHLWYTPTVEKTIFDKLSVPDEERTYAISFYEGTKCRLANGLACVEAPASEWAEQSMRHLWNTIGERSRSRVVAVEIGAYDPVVTGWGTEEALESAIGLIRKYGVEGGSFWRWVNNDNTEEANPNLGHPIKRRGISYTYFPVKDVLERLYKTP